MHSRTVDISTFDSAPKLNARNTSPIEERGYIRPLLEHQLTNPPTNNRTDNFAAPQFVPPCLDNNPDWLGVLAASVPLGEPRSLAIVATDAEGLHPPDLAKSSVAGCAVTTSHAGLPANTNGQGVEMRIVNISGDTPCSVFGSTTGTIISVLWTTFNPPALPHLKLFLADRTD
ncbi:hypothetical protein FRC12_017902 [Ceratobasidium sp. 428]|nr:hypothetical protein FRC12_017902 [Ceratobasidium sp. 428]